MPNRNQAQSCDHLWLQNGVPGTMCWRLDGRSRPTGGKKSEQERKRIQAVRHKGACLRCQILKQQVNLVTMRLCTTTNMASVQSWHTMQALCWSYHTSYYFFKVDVLHSTFFGGRCFVGKLYECIAAPS
jgi:hypothetical protein